MTVQYLGNTDELWVRSFYFIDNDAKYYFVDHSDHWFNWDVGRTTERHIEITKEHYGKIPTLELDIDKNQLLSEDEIVVSMLMTQLLHVFNEKFDL